jgi:hypothetical protein
MDVMKEVIGSATKEKAVLMISSLASLTYLEFPRAVPIAYTAATFIALRYVCCPEINVKTNMHI